MVDNAFLLNRQNARPRENVLHVVKALLKILCIKNAGPKKKMRSLNFVWVNTQTKIAGIHCYC